MRRTEVTVHLYFSSWNTARNIVNKGRVTQTRYGYVRGILKLNTLHGNNSDRSNDLTIESSGTNASGKLLASQDKYLNSAEQSLTEMMHGPSL